MAAGRPPRPEPAPLPEPAEPAPEPVLRPEEAAVAAAQAEMTGGRQVMWLRGMLRGEEMVPVAAPLRDQLWVVTNGHAGVHRWAAAVAAGANEQGAICSGFPSLGERRAFLQATAMEVPDRR